MKWRTFLLWLASTFFLLVTLLLLVGVNMRRGLNHDEYQFVASGQLMATTGLLPYRDFPYFHVPGLSLLYAGLFQLTPRLLLSARLFSVLCGWLLVVLLWVMTLAELRQERLWIRLAAASGLALLLVASPMFIYTSGRAWNHDLPVLLTILAMWVFDRERRQAGDPPGVQNPKLLSKTCLSRFGVSGAGLQPAPAVCGVLLGLATAIRLSFAFAVLAFIIVLLIVPKPSWHERRRGLLNFIVGGVIGALPALFFLLWAPQAFLFGNLTYIGLNTQYYRSLATPPQSMMLLGKLEFMGDLLRTQPANGLPLLSLVVAGVLVRRIQHNTALWPRLQLVALLWLGMLLSGLIATPSQTQYFYPLWPLVIFALGLLFSEVNHNDNGPGMNQRQPSISGPSLSRPRLITRLSMMLLVAGAFAAFLGRSPYQAGLEIVFSPHEWYPNKLHARGQWLRTLVNAGAGQSNAVLTVAPMLPLEGGIAIYPELATGPFAWRVAPLLTAAERHRYHLFTPDELRAQLTAMPPRALLVGLENDDADLEQSLVAWAQAQGYLPIALPDEGTLWVSSLAEWGGAIRLGAHTLPPTMQPGTTAEVVFYLQNIRPIATNLNILVRLVGVDGQEYWRAEGWPWGAATADWQPGDVWPDGHTLAIPAHASPGCYRVELSFYNPETFAPLGNAVDVGHLWVGDQPAGGDCP